MSFHRITTSGSSPFENRLAVALRTQPVALVLERVDVDQRASLTSFRPFSAATASASLSTARRITPAWSTASAGTSSTPYRSSWSATSSMKSQMSSSAVHRS